MYINFAFPMFIKCALVAAGHDGRQADTTVGRSTDATGMSVEGELRAQRAAGSELSQALLEGGSAIQQ